VYVFLINQALSKYLLTDDISLTTDMISLTNNVNLIPSICGLRGPHSRIQPSTPRLVARTSTFVWPKGYNEAVTRPSTSESTSAWRRSYGKSQADIMQDTGLRTMSLTRGRETELNGAATQLKLSIGDAASVTKI